MYQRRFLQRQILNGIIILILKWLLKIIKLFLVRSFNLFILYYYYFNLLLFQLTIALTFYNSFSASFKKSFFNWFIISNHIPLLFSFILIVDCILIHFIWKTFCTVSKYVLSHRDSRLAGQQERLSDWLVIAYHSAGSWKPPSHISDWLIFCCGNLIPYQKKKWKW